MAGGWGVGGLTEEGGGSEEVKGYIVMESRGGGCGGRVDSEVAEVRFVVGVEGEVEGFKYCGKRVLVLVCNVMGEYGRVQMDMVGV